MSNPYRPGRPLKYRPADGNLPPAMPGEYRIRDQQGNLLYIGETCNLERRTKEHMRYGKLTPASGGVTIECKIADIRSTSRTRRVHERAKIAQHNPRLNCSAGGEGCPARKK